MLYNISLLNAITNVFGVQIVLVEKNLFIDCSADWSLNIIMIQ